MKTLVHVNPLAEFRSMDDMFDRLFGRPLATAPNVTTLPVDVYEADGKFTIKASVPGVDPANLDVQIENNILTIRGEVKSDYENSDAKVYRREVSYGSFARSLRLPENLNLDEVNAEFANGFVTIAIPRQVEEKPKALKVTVRNVTEPSSDPQIVPSEN